MNNYNLMSYRAALPTFGSTYVKSTTLDND